MLTARKRGGDVVEVGERLVHDPEPVEVAREAVAREDRSAASAAQRSE